MSKRGRQKRRPRKEASPVSDAFIQQANDDEPNSKKRRVLQSDPSNVYQINEVKHVNINHIQVGSFDKSQLQVTGWILHSEMSTFTFKNQENNVFKLVINDGTADIEVCFWRNTQIISAQLQNAKAVKLTFTQNNVKQIKNQLYNKGSHRARINDPTVAACSNEGMNLLSKDIHMNIFSIGDLNNAVGMEDVDIIGLVQTDDEIKVQAKYNQTGTGRRLMIADESGRQSYFWINKTVANLADEVVCLKNVSVIKNGNYIQVRGGFVIHGELINTFFNNKQQQLKNKKDELGKPFDENDYTLASVMKYKELQHRVATSKKQVDDLYNKIVIEDSVIFSVNNQNNCCFIPKSPKSIVKNDNAKENLIYRIELTVTDESKKLKFDVTLWGKCGEEFLGGLPAEEFAKLSDSDKMKSFEAAQNQHWDVYLQNWKAESENKFIYLKSKVVRIIKSE